MKILQIILALFLVFGCSTAFPVDNTIEDTTPNYETNGSIWTSWYMIAINVLVPITMIISVACCCCCGSPKSKIESSKDESATRSKNETTKGFEMELRNQTTKSGKMQADFKKK